MRKKALEDKMLGEEEDLTRAFLVGTLKAHRHVLLRNYAKSVSELGHAGFEAAHASASSDAISNHHLRSLRLT